MKKYLILPLFLFSVILLGAGCEDIQTANREQDLTDLNQAGLLVSQPPPKLEYSLERENIIKRTNLWNSPNKVSYIYLINYGKVMAFYTIKGKVSSVDSQITNPEQLAARRIVMQDGAHYVEGTLPSPSEDGSYGTNGKGIYFFTTEGAYVEWAGDYMLADQPLKLTTQPELIREIK